MSQSYSSNCFSTANVIETDMQNVENNFDALRSLFSGSSAPTSPDAGQLWYDTGSSSVKIRYNSSWVEWWDMDGQCVAAGKVGTDSLASGAVTDAKVTSVGGSKITAGSIPSGKFQAGAIAGADIADGTITRAKIGAYTAGNYFIIGSDSEKTTAATSYTKVKEIVVTRTGTLRVSFALASELGGINAYGRVYRNGVAVGTARNTTSTVPQTYSEDISGWAPNDLCQIYACVQNVTSPGAKVTNFRLYTGAPEREYVTLD